MTPQKVLRHPSTQLVAAIVVTFLFVNVGLSSPWTYAFHGLVDGLLNALTAVGLILVYRTTRVINFAQTAIGAAGGELAFQLIELTRVPFLVALVLGLVLAAAVGLLFDLVLVRRLFRAPRLILTIATIAVASWLATALPRYIQSLPFMPKVSNIDQFLGNESLRSRLPFHTYTFQVGRLPIKYGFPELLAIGASVVVIAGIGMFLRYTDIGTAVQAIAQNLDRATLMGISTGVVSSTVWTLTGLLSGFGVILTGLITTPSASQGYAPELLLPALAAAVLARMERLPTAVIAAVLLSVASECFASTHQSDAPLVSVALFAIVAVGVLLQRTRGRSEEGAGVTWEATREQRGVPRELAVLPGIRLTRATGVVVVLVFLIAFPLLASTSSIVLGGVIALTVIMAMSLLVLTGWAGQVSLGQYAFAAVGAVVSGALSATVGLPWYLAVIVSMVLAGAFAVVVGIPALRIKGLFLAVTTFALGIAVSAAVFDPRYFGWLLPGPVNRPTLFIFDFENEQSMYYLCVLLAIAVVFFVINLRRSRFGRMLIAVRENDTNVQSLGISPTRLKLTAFGLSGALAGLAGAMLVFVERGVNADTYAAAASLTLFLFVVLGGVSSIAGCVIGAVVLGLITYFNTGHGLVNIILTVVPPQSFGVIVLLYIEPTGLIGVINRLRDGVLRIVAQRRQMIVPSLFADYDPKLLARRLIPLADRIPGSGLSAVQTDEPFAMASRHYIGLSRRTADDLSDKRAEETSTLATAAAAQTRALDTVEVPV